LLKNKDEDYFVFNFHSTRPKKIIFINHKDNKDDFENQNIGGKVISEIKLAKEINVIFSNENKSFENYYFNFLLGCYLKKYSFTKYKTIFKKNENVKEIINLLITSSSKNFFINIKNDIEIIKTAWSSLLDIKDHVCIFIEEKKEWTKKDFIELLTEE